MKRWSILLLVVFIVSISCFPVFATEASTYVIPAGEYLWNEALDYSMLEYGDVTTNYVASVPFTVDVDGSSQYAYIQLNVAADGVALGMYYSDQIPAPTGSSIYNSRTGWVSQGYRSVVFLEDIVLDDLSFFQFFLQNLNMTDYLMTNILDIFTHVGVWISSAASTLVSMFWIDSSLTFLGVLAVAGLALSVSFLVIGLLQNFMHFRG